MTLPRAKGRVRQVVGKTFDTTADVMRKSSVADTSGGQTDSYALFATYPCSLKVYPVRALERESGERIQSIIVWQFVFPFDADVQQTDRLETPDGRTFEVVGSGKDSFNIYVLITAHEII